MIKKIGRKILSSGSGVMINCVKIWGDLGGETVPEEGGATRD
jgi:hypothetical protein